MFVVHLLIATVIYFVISGLWLSKKGFSEWWVKLLHWSETEVEQSYNQLSKGERIMMFFSAVLAGLMLAIGQYCVLQQIDTSLVFYIIGLMSILLIVLALPMLPNYLFKSGRLGATLKESTLLWILELSLSASGH